MATLVNLHAHPDDEAIACGGTMARAAHAGQSNEGSFFLNTTPEVFAATWGKERYILRDAPEGTVEDWLLDDASL